MIDNDFLNGSLTPNGAKNIHVVRLATHKLLVSVVDAVGLELFATTHADKYIATAMQHFVLGRHWLRLKSLVTDITWVKPISLLCFVPHTDPIQQQHEFPHKPAINTCWFRCQQMSTPLEVHPKLYPCLKGDVAYGEADPFVCHQLCQVSVLQYFHGTAGSMDHQHVFRQAGLS